MNIILLSIIIAALWGYTPVIQKGLMEHYSSKFVFSFGSVVYTTIMICFIFLNRRELIQEYMKLKREHLYLFIFSAAICSFFANKLYSSALSGENGFMVVALTSAYPLFTLLYMNQEKDVSTIIGTILLVLGVALISKGK